MSQRTNGFTLMELLLVVGLLGLGLISTPFLSRAILQNSVFNTANAITSSARRAQTYAMFGRNNSNWGVYYTSGSLVVYSGNAYASRTASLDQTMKVNTNVSVSGFTDLNFSRRTGLPSATPTITISSTTTNATLTVNSEGVITK